MPNEMQGIMPEQEVLLQAPSDLAYELIEAEAGEPYIRSDRTDVSLITQIAITATSASTTVIVTKLTGNAVQRIAKAISSWRSRRNEDQGVVKIVVLPADSTQPVEVEVGRTTSVDEITQAIDRARARSDS
jgi:hypothetical protein